MPRSYKDKLRDPQPLPRLNLAVTWPAPHRRCRSDRHGQTLYD
jgi:hypothetical protein